MLVRLKRHFGVPVSGPDPGPAHLDATATERHLAALVTVPHRGPLSIVLAPRAHHVVDLQPDLNRQREQSLLRCPDQLAQRLLHPPREH